MEKNITNRHIVSFIALILPFLAYTFLNDNNFNLTQEDKKVIKFYIKLWWFFRILLIITATLWIISYFTIWTFWKLFGLVYQFSILVLILFLIVFIFNIFSWKDYNISSLSLDDKNNESQSVNDIIFFIPWYNFYLRYKYLLSWSSISLVWYKVSLLKESVFWWFLIMILGNNILSLLLLLVLIIRVVLLLFWIDILSNNIKNKILNFFKTNPEEILSYLVWIFFLILYYFQGKKIAYSDIVENLKLKYSKTYLIKDLKKDIGKFVCITSQNIFIFVLIIYSIVQVLRIIDYLFWLNFGITLLFIFILISRYLILWYQWVLIRIPVLDEICQLIRKLIVKFIKPV